MTKQENLKEALVRLQSELSAYRRPAIAFSGGLDSSVLLAVASGMGLDVRPISIVTPLVPQFEREDAKTVAAHCGVELALLELDPLSDSCFTLNSPDRCYHCKKLLMGAIVDEAQRQQCDAVLDGANLDDRGDYRPGMQAARELGIRSPFIAAGLGKREIRAIAEQMDLPVAGKPSYACLASRIAYGEPVTNEKLRRIERAEEALRGMGLTGVRVRCHDCLARIEVDSGQIAMVATVLRERVDQVLRDCGFEYVTLDLQGYRTGSMNARLKGISGEKA